MPFTVSFESPCRFVVHATGDITGAESLELLRNILHNARFGDGATILAVASGVTSAPATDELTAIALTVREMFGRGLKGLVIVTEPGFVYGVARMFKVMAEMMGVRAEVSQDEAEGRQFLEAIEQTTHR